MNRQVLITKELEVKHYVLRYVQLLTALGIRRNCLPVEEVSHCNYL